MLNYVFVPNTLVCFEPGGDINWKKLTPYIWKNLDYDTNLVAELEQYNEIRAPYREVVSSTVPTTLKLHEYYLTTQDITFTPEGSEESLDVPANSILLRWTVTDNSIRDYIILTRSQLFLQYQPELPQTDNMNPYSYYFSYFSPGKDNMCLRPRGELPHSDQRLMFTSNRCAVYDKIYYNFYAIHGRQEYTLKAPAYFTTDSVCAKLYLTQTSSDCILVSPAHFEVSLDSEGNHTLTLVLDTNITLPAQFYVEVF